MNSSSAPTKGARTATSSARRPKLLFGEMRFDLRQRRQQRVTDGLQAARADRIECIGGGVPLRIIEIDDVERGNACGEKWQMVVFDPRRLRHERGLTQLARGAP